MCNNCVPNRNPYRDAHPQSRLQSLTFHLSRATNRPEAPLQLSLISTITSDLDALARKGAKGFVFFTGNFQLQGPVSLNPTVGQSGLGSKLPSLSKKQRDW